MNKADAVEYEEFLKSMTDAELNKYVRSTSEEVSMAIKEVTARFFIKMLTEPKEN